MQKKNGGTGLELKVQPRSSRNQIVGLQGSALKIKLTAPPVDGAANKLCCDFLARQFGLPKSAVELLSGESSRHKIVLLRDLDCRQVGELLAPYIGDGSAS
ncbi:MAG: YggU family protein [Desulfuromonas sp.]|nr:MAG: YggU family protein [Desulfuromonas sp.]